MSKIKKKDFFSTSVFSVVDKAAEMNGIKETGFNSKMDKEEKKIQSEKNNINQVHLRKDLITSIMESAKSLREMGMMSLSADIVRLYDKVLEERFTVAFVGEFNRGKSSLINRLLNTNILPTSNLPSTALLTRITYGTPKMVVYGKKIDDKKELPLCAQSWEGLTASNFGEMEPEGKVKLYMNNDWLRNYPIDILDTPGAGDLEEKRAKVIGQALICADAAVIAISAASPLSLTEISFIKQKILSTKVPFIALAITKLDEIKLEERDNVIRFVKTKLHALKIDMPVVVADDNIKMPTDEFSPIVGLDKLKALFKIWLLNKDRTRLTEQWLSSNIRGVLNMAHNILLQQNQIFKAKDDEREKIIEQRLIALSKVHGEWQEFRNQMVERCKKCVDVFDAKVEECGNTIIERLQHEVDRMPSAKIWIEKEYSYRVKMELAAISLTLDSFIAKQISNDLRWLNNQLSNQFKTIMSVDIEGLESKESFYIDLNENEIQLDDLTKKRTQTTIATVALTLGASLALASFGGFIPLATLGLGTGANIFANTVFSKKAEEQRIQVKKIIAETIPHIITEASKDCKVKIKILYNNIISEALYSEKKWMQIQRTLIRDANKPQNEDDVMRVKCNLMKVETLMKQF